MPIYEFECERCHSEFEELVQTSSESVPCPQCGSSEVARVLSRFAFKSGDTFRSSSSKGDGCSGCHPGPSGCSHCKH